MPENDIEIVGGGSEGLSHQALIDNLVNDQQQVFDRLGINFDVKTYVDFVGDPIGNADKFDLMVRQSGISDDEYSNLIVSSVLNSGDIPDEVMANIAVRLRDKVYKTMYGVSMKGVSGEDELYKTLTSQSFKKAISDRYKSKYGDVVAKKVLELNKDKLLETAKNISENSKQISQWLKTSSVNYLGKDFKQEKPLGGIIENIAAEAGTTATAQPFIDPAFKLPADKLKVEQPDVYPAEVHESMMNAASYFEDTAKNAEELADTISSGKVSAGIVESLNRLAENYNKGLDTLADIENMSGVVNEYNKKRTAGEIVNHIKPEALFNENSETAVLIKNGLDMFESFRSSYEVLDKAARGDKVDDALFTKAAEDITNRLKEGFALKKDEFDVVFERTYNKLYSGVWDEVAREKGVSPDSLSDLSEVDKRMANRYPMLYSINKRYSDARSKGEDIKYSDVFYETEAYRRYVENIPALENLGNIGVGLFSSIAYTFNYLPKAVNYLLPDNLELPEFDEEWFMKTSMDTTPPDSDWAFGYEVASGVGFIGGFAVEGMIAAALSETVVGGAAAAVDLARKAAAFKKITSTFDAVRKVSSIGNIAGKANRLTKAISASKAYSYIRNSKIFDFTSNVASKVTKITGVSRTRVAEAARKFVNSNVVGEAVNAAVPFYNVGRNALKGARGDVLRGLLVEEIVNQTMSLAEAQMEAEGAASDIENTVERKLALGRMVYGKSKAFDEYEAYLIRNKAELAKQAARETFWGNYFFIRATNIPLVSYLVKLGNKTGRVGNRLFKIKKTAQGYRLHTELFNKGALRKWLYDNREAFRDMAISNFLAEPFQEVGQEVIQAAASDLVRGMDDYNEDTLLLADRLVNGFKEMSPEEMFRLYGVTAISGLLFQGATSSFGMVKYMFSHDRKEEQKLGAELERLVTEFNKSGAVFNIGLGGIVTADGTVFDVMRNMNKSYGGAVAESEGLRNNVVDLLELLRRTGNTGVFMDMIEGNKRMLEEVNDVESLIQYIAYMSGREPIKDDRALAIEKARLKALYGVQEDADLVDAVKQGLGVYFDDVLQFAEEYQDIYDEMYASLKSTLGVDELSAEEREELMRLLSAYEEELANQKDIPVDLIQLSDPKDAERLKSLIKRNASERNARVVARHLTRLRFISEGIKQDYERVNKELSVEIYDGVRLKDVLVDKDGTFAKVKILKKLKESGLYEGIDKARTLEEAIAVLQQKDEYVGVVEDLKDVVDMIDGIVSLREEADQFAGIITAPHTMGKGGLSGKNRHLHKLFNMYNGDNAYDVVSLAKDYYEKGLINEQQYYSFGLLIIQQFTDNVLSSVIAANAGEDMEAGLVNPSRAMRQLNDAFLELKDVMEEAGLLDKEVFDGEQTVKISDILSKLESIILTDVREDSVEVLFKKIGELSAHLEDFIPDDIEVWTMSEDGGVGRVSLKEATEKIQKIFEDIKARAGRRVSPEVLDILISHAVLKKKSDTAARFAALVDEEDIISAMSDYIRAKQSGGRTEAEKRREAPGALPAFKPVSEPPSEVTRPVKKKKKKAKPKKRDLSKVIFALETELLPYIEDLPGDLAIPLLQLFMKIERLSLDEAKEVVEFLSFSDKYSWLNVKITEYEGAGRSFDEDYMIFKNVTKKRKSAVGSMVAGLRNVSQISKELSEFSGTVFNSVSEIDKRADVIRRKIASAYADYEALKSLIDALPEHVAGKLNVMIKAGIDEMSKMLEQEVITKKGLLGKRVDTDEVLKDIDAFVSKAEVEKDDTLASLYTIAAKSLMDISGMEDANLASRVNKLMAKSVLSVNTKVFAGIEPQVFKNQITAVIDVFKNNKGTIPKVFYEKRFKKAVGVVSGEDIFDVLDRYVGAKKKKPKVSKKKPKKGKEQDLFDADKVVTDLQQLSAKGKITKKDLVSLGITSDNAELYVDFAKKAIMDKRATKELNASTVKKLLGVINKVAKVSLSNTKCG